MKLRPEDVRRVVDLTVGMLLIKLTFFHIDYTRTRTFQLCFVSANKIRIQFFFSQSQCCSIDYFKYC